MPRKINTAQRINAVIYARTGRHCTGQLNAQVSRLRTFAARHGWSEPVVITECRGSGMSDQVLRAVTGFDVLLVGNYDRLARGVTGMHDVVRALSGSGVRVVTPAAGPSAEAVPFEMLLFQAIAAQGARGDLSRWTRAGMAAARSRQAGRQ